MSLQLPDVIQSILVRWTALRMSVEHQAGGPHSRQKATYLVLYLQEALTSKSKIEAEDLEDVLCEYMDSELNTILEDGSEEEVSKTLVSLYEKYTSGQREEVERFVCGLPPCADWLQGDGGGRPAAAAAASDSDNETQLEPMESVDCEWTQVTYKKKR